MVQKPLFFAHFPYLNRKKWPENAFLCAIFQLIVINTIHIFNMLYHTILLKILTKVTFRFNPPPWPVLKSHFFKKYTY